MSASYRSGTAPTRASTCSAVRNFGGLRVARGRGVPTAGFIVRRRARTEATGAKWATWKRYCCGGLDGRAVTMLIDRELVGVFGDVAGGASCLCLLNVPQKSWRFERPRSSPGSVRSVRERRGCASGVSDCDGGRMHLRPGSNRLKLCQSSRHVNRRVAPRSGATNAAPAGQASSTSTAMALPAAEHNAGKGYPLRYSDPSECGPAHPFRP